MIGCWMSPRSGTLALWKGPSPSGPRTVRPRSKSAPHGRRDGHRLRWV